MGGGRRRPARATGPRCRGDLPVLPYPIDRRLHWCSARRQGGSRWYWASSHPSTRTSEPPRAWRTTMHHKSAIRTEFPRHTTVSVFRYWSERKVVWDWPYCELERLYRHHRQPGCPVGTWPSASSCSCAGLRSMRLQHPRHASALGRLSPLGGHSLCASRFRSQKEQDGWARGVFALRTAGAYNRSIECGIVIPTRARRRW